MKHGVLCGNPLSGVALEHLIEQVDAEFVQPWHHLCEGLRLILRIIWFVEGKVLHLRPCLESRGASALENLHKLVLFVLPGEEWSAGHELCEDAANRPNIDRGVIVL